MFKKWIKTFILFLTHTIFAEDPSPWTHYEKSYTGGCISSENSRSPCINFGEHAYKGYILDEPPKGAAFYMDDLEPFNEGDYLMYDREKRGAKRKENKYKQHKPLIHQQFSADDDNEEELNMEKQLKKGSIRKKNKLKKEEKMEKEMEDEEEDEDECGDDDDDDEETNDEDDTEEDAQQVSRRDKIKK